MRYGEDSSQFADLRLPRERPVATVVLLHGGYWFPQYGLDLMEPLASTLTGLGFATWNLEYRRTGAGGGFPSTFHDVAAAVDHLDSKDVPTGLAEDVVLLGHSAGGQLAVWAASRSPATPGGAPRVRPRGAVSLAGVLDLTLAATAPGSAAPVTALMGGRPDQLPEEYALADPAQLVPAGCPVWAVHASADATVPLGQSSSYVAKAKAAGGRARQVLVPGDHATIIDPQASSFASIERLVRRAVVPDAE